ncbi:MAG: type I phosphomannose isomerase catalytic subunit [Acidimicrobiia bacterium]
MALDPFLLEAVPVERPWGGRRLADYGTALPADLAIGESWEVADLPQSVAPHVADPNSRVAAGPHVGVTLHELIASHRGDLLCEVAPTSDGRFPLLVKLLDARENLSVQVHPPQSYVGDHPGTRFKTESWYVVEAEPGAILYLDLNRETQIEDVAEAFDSNAVVDLLTAVPAIAGSFHHVPAGLVHAIGAGVVIAEVQTPSDTTFRLYDWASEYEREPRDIHKDESLQSIALQPEAAYDLGPMSGEESRTLTDNDYYWIREHVGLREQMGFGTEPGPRVVCVTSGTALVGDLEVRQGMTAIVPACAVLSSRIDLHIGSRVLEIGLPA